MKGYSTLPPWYQREKHRPKWTDEIYRVVGKAVVWLGLFLLIGEWLK